MPHKDPEAHRAYQREYRKQHYARNKDAYLSRAKERYPQALRERREYILQILTASGCLDCAEKDVVVLQFDHARGTKVATIAVMVKQRAGWEKLKEEIAKCDVVCANCHTRRTASRAGDWYRALLVQSGRDS